MFGGANSSIWGLSLFLHTALCLAHLPEVVAPRAMASAAAPPRRAGVLASHDPSTPPPRDGGRQDSLAPPDLTEAALGSSSPLMRLLLAVESGCPEAALRGWAPEPGEQRS